MFRRAWRVVFLLPILISGLARAQIDPPNPVLVPPAPLHERVLRVPGDPDRPVTLEVTMYTPPGAGPFPLAVMNHGATNIGRGNRGERYRYTFSAYYFLSRGYAVAMPMARGFAGSGGDLVAAGCDLEKVGLMNARDVRSVIEAVSAQPYIDRSRIVVGGQSFGGWTTMALGTMDVPGVRGLIGFSPAIRASDCAWQDQAMIANARWAGANARYPSIWFYGENDTVMPEATWRGVFAAYAKGTPGAALVKVGAFLDDSHQMLSFPEGLPIWTPPVDAFLAKIGLPSGMKFAEYMPSPGPPATRFAAIGDVNAVPGLNDKGRDAYRRFLNLRFPRVFLLAQGGGLAVLDGGFDPLARGLAACRKAGAICQPYAIDSQVVWVGGQAPERTYARTVPAGQATRLDFSSAVNRDCSSRGVPNLWISEGPKHGTALVTRENGHPGFPAGHPFAGCNEMTVPGTAVTYTPSPGFAGEDALAFEETDVDGGHHAFHMTLTVR